MYVPSLVALCVTALAPYVDHAHALPVRLRLRSRLLIDHLVPDHALLDPRLWATIIQVFESDGLPPAFASHTLPLLHPHQSLLQSIPYSSNFSLITSLFLQGCIHITDATILHLKALHTLTALDVSNTSLTDYAIQTMAATLHFNEDTCTRQHSGPWPLRILALRNCKQITNQVFGYLDKFPLLSVLDLRGTLCSPNMTKAFDSCSNTNLYHPSSLSTALATLRDIQPDIYSSSNFYILNVTTFRPPRQPSQSSSVAPQDAFVVIPPNKSRITVGNTFILERQTQEREEALRHERNKESWYRRREILDSRQFEVEGTTARMKTPKPRQIEMDLALFITTPAHRPDQDATLSQRSSRIGVLPLPPKKQQVCTRSSRVPFKSHALLPNPQGLTTSGLKVPGPVRQRTVPNTEVSMQTPVAHTSAGSRRKSDSLPSAFTSQGPIVFGTAPTGFGRSRAVVTEIGSRALDTAVQRPENRNIVSTNRFYEPLPRLPRSRPSSAPRECLPGSTKPTADSRCKDELLMLYRDPPAWSALNAAVEHRRSEEETASQHREWQRMKPRHEVAIVDMNSAKAALLKRQLCKFIEVSGKQQRVHQSEYESDSHPRFLQHTPAELVAIQPSQSTNPFRKRGSNEDLMPTPTPMAEKQPFSTLEAISIKPLFPISTIRIPLLPLDVREAALVRNNVGSADANPRKRLKARSELRIPGKTKEAQRKSTDSGYKTLSPSKSRKEKPSAVAFDWKSWGKT